MQLNWLNYLITLFKKKNNQGFYMKFLGSWNGSVSRAVYTIINVLQHFRSFPLGVIHDFGLTCEMWPYNRLCKRFFNREMRNTSCQAADKIDSSHWGSAHVSSTITKRHQLLSVIFAKGRYPSQNQDEGPAGTACTQLNSINPFWQVPRRSWGPVAAMTWCFWHWHTDHVPPLAGGHDGKPERCCQKAKKWIIRASVRFIPHLTSAQPRKQLVLPK